MLPSQAQTVPNPRASAKREARGAIGLEHRGRIHGKLRLGLGAAGVRSRCRKENAADRIRRQGRQSQTQTSAHTAEVRRRRAIDMVTALIMGAGYKATRPLRQDVKPSFRAGPKDQTRNFEVTIVRCSGYRPGMTLRVRSPGSTVPEPAGSRFRPSRHCQAPEMDSGNPERAFFPRQACRRSCAAWFRLEPDPDRRTRASLD